MIKMMSRPTSPGIPVRTGQQSPNPASPFQTRAQIYASRVADGWIVAAVPLLDHPHLVVNVAILARQGPTAPVPSVFGPFAQPRAPIIHQIPPIGVRIDHLRQSVLIVIAQRSTRIAG